MIRDWENVKNIKKSSFFIYRILLYNTTMCAICPHTTETETPLEDRSPPVVQSIIIVLWAY